ncbi:uncharacterized protein LOC111287250 isoform X1 [Durio zibethinus]|uniref:Uncharacterized protein LOC111287250 isoform X1 n=1 Tax=Durio zibethinus TaxID=66656 RepID=A0A6P5XYY6_DURZI|nr:uncharacterized protein LOC111287250 isoform X1 [Durio zibethinus]
MILNTSVFELIGQLSISLLLHINKYARLFSMLFLMLLSCSLPPCFFFSPFGWMSQFSRTKKGASELDLYLSRKHDELLASTLQAGSYKKTLSLVIVDGFAVEITEAQANVLRSANGVRVVEKNQELA